MHGALDSFIQVIEEHKLQPQDIEKITALEWPIHRFISDNKMKTTCDIHFSTPYGMSCAAYRIHPARWLDQELKRDRRIQEFMRRVEFDQRCDEKELGLARLKDPQSEPMGVEVVAKGKTFKKMTLYRKGMWRPEEFRSTDEELIKKFRENVSRVLPSHKTDEAVKTLFELEKLNNVVDLIKMVAP